MDWDDQYQIGVTFIDDQHREWFRRVGLLGQAIERGDTREEMAGALRFAVEYTQQHFADEEAYMTQHAYPALEAQRKLHKYFEKYICDVLVDLKSGKAVPPAKLHAFMSDWMVQHIRQEDLKIGMFMARSAMSDDPQDGSADHQGDDLEEKLTQLAGLFESELISQEDFDTKKQDFVRQFAGVSSNKGAIHALAMLDRLKTLIEKGLLTDDELAAGRGHLAGAVNVARELARQESLKDKMVHLKRLLEEQIIDETQFESHKSEILNQM